MRFFTEEIMQILASAFRDGGWQTSKEDTRQILKCKFLYKHIQTNTSNSPREQRLHEAFPNKLFDLYDLAFDIFKLLLVIFDRKSLRRCELLFCDVISLFNISLVFRCHLRTKIFLPSFVPFSWFILWTRDHFASRLETWTGFCRLCEWFPLKKTRLLVGYRSFSVFLLAGNSFALFICKSSLRSSI